MTSPTLAVVMPNYNHAEYLASAIDSILAQTRRPDEFLILDDASTDHSVELIESYVQRHPWIKFIRAERNLGVNAAHRRLFESVASDYVLAMAADDRRYERCCESALRMAAQYPAAGLIIGQMVVTVDGVIEGTFGVRRWPEPLYAAPERYLRDFLLAEAPSHSLLGATVFRREPFREVGWYCDALGPWGDTFAAFAVGLKHGVCYVPEPFAEWRKFSHSFSQMQLADPRRTIDMIQRAAYLMRSPQFRDRFPEQYVRTWQRRYKWQTIMEFWRGDHNRRCQPDQTRWQRYRERLPRTWEAISLWWRHTDLSPVRTS